MIFFNKVVLLIPLLLFFTDVLPNHNIEKVIFSFTSDKKLQVGEELTYIAKYAFIVLGQVKLKILDKKNINNKIVYNTVAYIDSYSSIPFVDIHQIYKSKVSDKYYSFFFQGIVKKEEYDTFTDYTFDYDSSKIHVKKGKISPRQIWTDSTTTIKEKYQDGLSIFYYARVNSGQKKSEKIQGFVDEKKVSTQINFYNEVSDISIDAIDYPVACVKVDGDLDYISIYGLTGHYEGWFTDDEAAVPIIARMKVMIGNITLELKEWKRQGWKPPEYKK
jgi:Protein of unknown function (DUF3108)